MTQRILWARIDPWDKEMAIAALESGVSTLWLPDGCAALARELGRVTVVAADGDLVEGRDFGVTGIESAADEARVAASSDAALWVVRPAGREIIPLENLVAWRRRILVEARTPEAVSLYLGVLEKGVAGLVLRADSPEAMRKLAAAAMAEPERVALVEARVTAVELLGVGDRVCVDTCSLIEGSKGMLVGNSSAGLFLVCAENIANPYVMPRPFRVNAGAVHSYCRTAGGRTAYLSELSSGSELLLVDEQGRGETATVGRAKIERRPLLLVRAKSPSGREHSVILQNAETIRVVGAGGKAISVATLAPGDSVLVAEEAAGRHFGVAVDETIREN
jgi:3-dehydroquinate synthase II